MHTDAHCAQDTPNTKTVDNYSPLRYCPTKMRKLGGKVAKKGITTESRIVVSLCLMVSTLNSFGKQIQGGLRERALQGLSSKLAVETLKLAIIEYFD